MSFGKVYTRPSNPRTTAIRAVTKVNGLDIEFVDVKASKDCGPEYREINPLAKVPTFVRHDGFLLSECIAILIYLTRQDKTTTLLGETEEEYAQILRWMSFVNSDVFDALGGWFLPLVGRRPYDRESVQEHILLVEKQLRVMEDRLAHTTYLAGEKLSLADIFCIGMLSRGFQVFFDAEWRERFPRITTWAVNAHSSEIIQAVTPGQLGMVERAIPNQPPSTE